MYNIIGSSFFDVNLFDVTQKQKQTDAFDLFI